MATDVHGNILEGCPPGESPHQTAWCNSLYMRKKCPYRTYFAFREYVKCNTKPEWKQNKAIAEFNNALDELGGFIINNTIKFYEENNMLKEITQEQTIQALRDSIEHWETDIMKPLQKGNAIRNENRSLFWRSGGRVACKERDCALCQLIIGKSNSEGVWTKGCAGCPLLQAGHECRKLNSPYSYFFSNPCLETAQNMVLVLKNLLIDALEEKRRKECGKDVEKEIELKVGQIWQYVEKCYHLIVAVEKDSVKHVCFLFLKSPIFRNDSLKRFRRDYIFCPNAKIKVEEK